MIVRPSPIEAVRLNARTGYGEINPLRDVTRSWAQGTQRNVRQSIAASGLADDLIEVAAERGLTGDFEITHFTSDALGSYRVELYAAGGTDKRLSNAPVHIDLLAGSSRYPFFMPESIFLEARNNLNVRFTNLTAGITNQIRFVAHGRRFLDYENAITRKELIRQFYGRNSHPFWLVLDDTTIALAADATNQRALMSVPGDADFEAEYLVAKSTGPFRLVIREGSGNARPIISSGGTISSGNNGVPSFHMCGDARLPYKFTPDTAYFKRQMKVEVVLDDLSGVANTVEIALVGRLLYYPESPDRARVISPGTSPGLAFRETAEGPVVKPLMTSSPAPQGSAQPRYLRLPWWPGGAR